MKKLTFLGLVFLLFGNLFSQQQDDYFGEVNSYAGKFVFWHHQPVNEYEIVFVFAFQYSIIDLHQNQSAQSEEGVRTAFMASMGKDFDAIIVGNGSKNDVAIKFKNPDCRKALCKPIQINNSYVYIDANPIFDYSVVELVGYKRRQEGMSKIKYFTSRNIADNLSIKSKANCLIIGNGNNHEWIERR